MLSSGIWRSKSMQSPWNTTALSLELKCEATLTFSNIFRFATYFVQRNGERKSKEARDGGYRYFTSFLQLGHSLTRCHQCSSRLRYLRGFGIRLANARLPSDLSGQRWRRFSTPSCLASSQTVWSALTA